MNNVKDSHPIRYAIRPLRKFALSMVPLLIIYGFLSQFLYENLSSSFLGFTGKQILITISLFLFLLLVTIKSLIFQAVSKKQGVDRFAALKQLFIGRGHIRIITSFSFMIVLLSAVFIELGQTNRLVGLFALLTGSIYILMPLTIPIKGITLAGFVLVVAGAIFLFRFQAYPFYQIGFTWSIAALIIGLTDRQKKPEKTVN